MAVLDAWFEAASAHLPAGADVWDAHTHTGSADPDGVTNTAEALIAALDGAGLGGAVVMSSRDPSGYRDANDRILAEAVDHPDRLIPFLRVDPNHPGAVDEATRSLERGHRGVKLHPRGESFSLDHPRVADVARSAAEVGAPLLVHAGRGMPPLGRAVLDLVDDAGVAVILAHCGISDLAWLVPEARSRPGILFDTAWWNPADLALLFASVNASQVLYASDTPYGSPSMNVVLTMRAAVQAALDDAALAAVFGGNLQAVVSGEERAPLGMGDGPRLDAAMMRIASYASGAISVSLAGGDPTEAIELALRSSETSDDGISTAIHQTLEAALHSAGRTRLGCLVAAASAAFTPDVPWPRL